MKVRSENPIAVLGASNLSDGRSGLLLTRFALDVCQRVFMSGSFCVLYFTSSVSVSHEDLREILINKSLCSELPTIVTLCQSKCSSIRKSSFLEINLHGCRKQF